MYKSIIVFGFILFSLLNTTNAVAQMLWANATTIYNSPVYEYSSVLAAGTSWCEGSVNDGKLDHIEGLQTTTGEGGAGSGAYARCLVYSSTDHATVDPYPFPLLGADPAPTFSIYLHNFRPGYYLTDGICVGDPILVGNGANIQNNTDYKTNTNFPLKLTRYYSSYQGTGTFGNWKHNYERNMTPVYTHRNWPPIRIKSRSFTTKEAACLQGWNDIRGNISDLGAFAASSPSDMPVNFTPAASVPVTGLSGVSGLATYSKFNGSGCVIYYGQKRIGDIDISYDYDDPYYREIYIGKVVLTRPDGKIIRLYPANGTRQFKSGPEEGYKLEFDGNNWKLSTPDNQIEIYEGKIENLLDGHLTNITMGKLKEIISPYGRKQTLNYDEQGQLASVVDEGGRSLEFSYIDGRITSITAPAGKVYQYEYNLDNRLVKVIKPDNTTREYVYQGGTSYAGALTGIIDENTNDYATWQYDSNGRAISSENAGGVEKVTLEFVDDKTTVVTNSLGGKRTYHYDDASGKKRTTSITGDACASCSGLAASFEYADSGLISKRIDRNGNITTYTYDDRGLETQRVEAVGTPEERTIDTTWDTRFRLPKSVKTTVKNEYFSNAGVVTYNYDNGGRLKSKYEYANGYQPRVWSYLYDSNGLLTTVYNPLYKTTRFEYDTQFNLAKITNALGHITQITNYDTDGNPLQIIDPNGLITNLTYDVRGRLLSRDIGGEITYFAYDGVGNVTRITLPDGSYLNYTYDPAHRLIGVENQLGDRISYTLDLEGNQLKEDVFDQSGTLVRSKQQIYNKLSQLVQEHDSNNQGNVYSYDNNGNLTNTTDAMNRATNGVFDALNRVTKLIDPLNGETSFTYDKYGNIKSVTAPNNSKTNYSYDGVGQRLTESSPDKGTSYYGYDNAGNIISFMNANYKTTYYQYDAINRLTKTTYADGTIATYEYDIGANAIGHLSRITDSSGITDYAYDTHGRVVNKTQTIDSNIYSTTYNYNAVGQMVQMVYPSGITIDYVYANGVVNSLLVNGQPILSNITYAAFGDVTDWDWRNGQHHSRQYDADGKVNSFSLAAENVAVDYDLVGNILSLSSTSLTQVFSYDDLDRIVSANDANYDQIFSYDANGNRLSLTEDSTTKAYAYKANSNKLMSVDSRAYTSDNLGNTLSDGIHTYSYNVANRLSTVDGVIGYQYNALGQRVSKSVSGNNVFYAYDENGQTIGDYREDGSSIQEYVYLGFLPVAVVQGGVVYDIHTDHLGTARAVTTETGTVIWRWASKAFGSTPANDDPDGDGVAFTMNLRFPGQYYDAETGLHYNYFRYYDPSTGRYITSDPIGLEGGLNTYGYVGGNPITNIDPYGLNQMKRSPYAPGGAKAAPTKPFLPRTISITWTTGLPGARIKPSVTQSYNSQCLVTFGLAGKATASVVSTVALQKAPEYLSRKGFTTAASLAGRAALIFNNPISIVTGAVTGASGVLHHCQEPPPPPQSCNGNE